MKTFEDLALKDVAPLTESTDYKDRFLGEYLETKIRYNKLHKMLIKAEAHNLDFKPDCPLNVLVAQIHHMGNYLHAWKFAQSTRGLTSVSALKVFCMIWRVLNPAAA